MQLTHSLKARLVSSDFPSSDVLVSKCAFQMQPAPLHPGDEMDRPLAEIRINKVTIHANPLA
jgi:hypothetical protein